MLKQLLLSVFPSAENTIEVQELQIQSLQRELDALKQQHNKLTFDPLEDGISRLTLIDFMGGDLSVANDARASFDRVSPELTEKDKKLIHYLIHHEHHSPLRGTVFKFKVKAPLSVARQWWKYCVASAHVEEQNQWNESSFRFLDMSSKAEFYIPNTLRQQSTDNRQCSSGELDPGVNTHALEKYESSLQRSLDDYRHLVDLGVAREQARNLLPPAVYTSWVWTASLQTVLHFCDQRLGEGAQHEIAAYARAVRDVIQVKCPVVYEAWVS